MNIKNFSSLVLASTLAISACKSENIDTVNAENSSENSQIVAIQQETQNNVMESLKEKRDEVASQIEEFNEKLAQEQQNLVNQLSEKQDDEKQK